MENTRSNGALQTKDLTIAELERKNQEWELAYNELVQRAFGNRSERYIHNPDQLRLDNNLSCIGYSSNLTDGVWALVFDQTI